MILSKEFAVALNISETSSDEDISNALTALLTSAICDSSSKYTLSQIYHFVSEGFSALLNALDTLPLLIHSPNPAARDIISLIAECCPPKEVVMVVQEQLEKMGLADDEDEDSEDEKNVKSDTISLPNRLIILVDVYGGAIPRLRPRKAAQDTLNSLLSPLFTRLDSVQKSIEEGRSLIISVAILVERVEVWTRDVCKTDEEKNACMHTLRKLLETTLVSCQRSIRSSIAQRIFQQNFPRFTVTSAVGSGWENGEEAVMKSIEVFTKLNLEPKKLLLTPGPSSIILLAYWNIETLDPDVVLSATTPALIASIQSNTTLDESLALLLKTMCKRQVTHKHSLSPEIVAPLCQVLPTVASAHPDPLVRHQTFRILALLLSASAPQLRLQLLSELATTSDFPQMRVAAVGLVKDAVLEALSSASSTPNPFVSSIFLRVFGPILFSPNPPDLFSTSLSPHDFLESQESRRLVECLALYYVVLRRDTSNLTDIRSKDVLMNVEKTLLAPLRKTVDKWISDDIGSSRRDSHNLMFLVSLKMSLERVDAARAALLGAP